MSVGIGTSFILSSVLSIVLFCGMQIYRPWLASTALHTIFGGYLSSLLFVLILTVSFYNVLKPLKLHKDASHPNLSNKILKKKFSKTILFSLKEQTSILTLFHKAVGNIETALFGKAFQTKLFPEVFTCLMLAVFAASMIHRVCITTCILFSMASLYFMNKLSQVVYAVPVVVPSVQGKKKKGN